jgi:hypothetical protein
MKPYHKNPRTLSEKQFKNLKRDLLELGDLSGIVHDLNTDEIIGGNQRVRVLDIKPGMITLIEKFRKPTKTGTVATGFVTFNGEKYNYRQVKWTPKQCEKANIVANKAGGDWDMDVLANQFEIEDLKDWGFEDFDLGGIDLGGDSEGLKEEQEEKKTHFSFSSCYKKLKTNGVEYFALFRNNDMDLEKLKENLKNVDIFVLPVVETIKSMGIKNIAVAPSGARAEKNGFHFATELLRKVKEIVDINILLPFKNKNNHIEYSGKKIPSGTYLFDDIVTRGTTIKKMSGFIQNNAGILVLISNH